MGKDLITTPFHEDVFNVEVSSGQTIVEVVHAAKIPMTIWDSIVIALNGIEVKQDNWADV